MHALSRDQRIRRNNKEDRRPASNKNASFSGDPSHDDGTMLVLPGDHLGSEPFAVEPAPIADPDVWPPPIPTPESDNLNRAPRSALPPSDPACRGDPVTRIRGGHHRREGCAVAAPLDGLCSEKAVDQHLPVWARSRAIPAPDGGGGSENGGGNDAGPGARVGAARRRDGAVVQQKVMVFGEGGGGDRGGGAHIGPRRGGRGEWSLKVWKYFNVL